MANKYLKRDQKGRPYDSRFFTKKQINDLRYKDKKIKLNKITERTIYEEKTIKINKERIDKKTGKLLKKGDTIKKLIPKDKIFVNEEGKKVSSLKARIYRERNKENKKAFKRKLEKQEKQGKNLQNKNIEETCSEYFFNEFFDEFSSDAFNDIPTYFNNKKINSTSDVEDIYNYVRDLLKTKSYPEFIVRCEFNNILKDELVKITYTL